MVARCLALVLAALVRRAFAAFVMAALREGRGGGAGQEAQRSQGEEKVFHKMDENK